MIDYERIEPAIVAWRDCHDMSTKQQWADDIVDFLAAEYDHAVDLGESEPDVRDEVIRRCPPELREDLLRALGRPQRFDEALQRDEEELAPRQATARLECVIGAIIGRGGQAIVYQALSGSPEHAVAVKVPVGDAWRLLREARVLARLNHAAIVPLLGRGKDDHGRDVIVMRRLTSTTLVELIKTAHSALDATSPFPKKAGAPVTELFRSFLTVCRAVHYAHEEGVIHRDLHPGNLMIHNGEPVIIDWGLAWMADDDEATRKRFLQEIQKANERMSGEPTAFGRPISELMTNPRTTAAIGTVAYRSPEQTSGPWDRVTDRRSDVYSLGAILYSITTGQRPGDSGESADGHLVVPRPLNAIIKKAMSKRIEDRHPTTEALALDLEKFLAGQPVDPYREPWWEKTARWIGMHQTKVVSLCALVFVALILMLGGSWLLFQAQVAAILDENTRRLADALKTLLTATDPLGLERRGFRGVESGREVEASLDVIMKITEPVTKDSKDAAKISAVARANVLDSLGNAYRAAGRMDVARPLIEKGLKLREASKPCDPETLAQSYFHLGLLEQFIGNYPEAEAAYAMAVRLTRETPTVSGHDPDEEHRRELAKIQFHQAWLLGEMRRAPEAIQLLQEVITTRKDLDHGLSQDVRYAQLAKMIIQVQEGGLTSLQKILSEFKEADDPISKVFSNYIVARIARDVTKNVRAARQQYQRTLNELVTIVPPRHPAIALLLGDMASLEIEDKQYVRAWELIREAVEIGIETAPTHPELLSAMDRIADDAPKGGLDEKADELFRRVIEACQKAQPVSVREEAIRRLRADRAKLPKYQKNPELLDRPTGLSSGMVKPRP